MTARVSLQACGCIALPNDIAQALQVGPGSILQWDVSQPGSLTLTRISPPAQPAIEPAAACPVP